MLSNYLRVFTNKRFLLNLLALCICIGIFELISLCTSNKFLNGPVFSIGFVVVFQTLSDMTINKILIGKFSLTSYKKGYK